MKTEYKGYIIEQCESNKHIMINKDGRFIFHANMDENAPIYDEAGLREFLAFYEALLKGAEK